MQTIFLIYFLYSKESRWYTFYSVDKSFTRRWCSRGQTQVGGRVWYPHRKRMSPGIPKWGRGSWGSAVTRAAPTPLPTNKQPFSGPHYCSQNLNDKTLCLVERVCLCERYYIYMYLLCCMNEGNERNHRMSMLLPLTCDIP